MKGVGVGKDGMEEGNPGGEGLLCWRPQGAGE